MSITNISEILEIYREMKEYYAALRNQWKEDEQFYDLEISEMLRLPKRFKKNAVVLPTSREVVETAVDHIAPQMWRVTVPRKSESSAAIAQAQKLQRFYEALLHYFDRNATVSPFREGAKHISLYGRSDWRIYVTATHLPDEPRRADFDTEEAYQEAYDGWRESRNLTLPYKLYVINPYEVLPDPFNEEPEWVIQLSSKQVGHLGRVYPYWPNKNGLKVTALAEVVEYIDNKVRAVIIDGQPALRTSDGGGVVQHRWGVHPFIIGGSGLGYDDTEHRPEKRYIGMLRHIRDVLLAESRSFSIADIVMAASAWPIQVAQGDRANEVPALKLEYGDIQPLPPGVTISNLAPSLPPDLLFSFLQLTNSIVSSQSPRVLRGLPSPGTTSGFDRQLQLGPAKLRYTPISHSLQNMMTRLCQKTSIISRRVVKGSISLASSATQNDFISVSPNDFKNHHAVMVKLNVLEPEDEIRRHQDGIAMVNSNVMSVQDFIRIYRPDTDPDEEFVRIWATRALFSPQVAALTEQAILSRLAQNLGLEGVLEAITESAGHRNRRNRGQGQRRQLPAVRDTAEEGPGSRSEQARMRELDLRELGV